MANNLFNMLSSNLKNANSQPPMFNTIALGFTKTQVFTANFKKPRLIFYHAGTKTFYDQGDSTKIKKNKWSQINESNYKSDKPIKDLQYYIPISTAMIAESDKPLD